MGYVLELEEQLLMLLPGLISGIPTGLFGIAAYILTAVAFYTISRRRGLNKPWLAWVPVVNCWLLGSLSDQYQYVVKGENKSKRKWLLMLNIAKSILILCLTVMGIITAAGIVFGIHDAGMMRSISKPLMGVLGLTVPMAAVTIALCIIRYMALFDVYRSLDPDNAVLYLVLSILFSPTEPFFLFFNRDKDQGMPPRKRQPVYEQPVYEQPVSEQFDTYETVDANEYL